MIFACTSKDENSHTILSLSCKKRSYSSSSMLYFQLSLRRILVNQDDSVSNSATESINIWNEVHPTLNSTYTQCLSTQDGSSLNYKKIYLVCINLLVHILVCLTFGVHWSGLLQGCKYKNNIILQWSSGSTCLLPFLAWHDGIALAALLQKFQLVSHSPGHFLWIILLILDNLSYSTYVSFIDTNYHSHLDKYINL